MSLSDLNVKKVYRTKQDDYVGLFLVPALKESTTYDRGAGYFSLASLAELADGLIPFIQHGGAIRVVTSVELSDADVEIIKKGSLINEQVVKRNLQGQIAKGIYDEDSLCKLDYITNLIAAGLLEIKIAYMPDGIYHEKIGLLTDNEGNSIYFSGSNNATVSGLQKNWETVMVLTSWWGDGETIKDQQLYFNNLWNDDFDGLTVMSFPEAEKHDLIRKYKASPDVREAIKRVQQISERRKKKRELYDYQKIAVQQFLENKGNHFYEMATGTGKTFTAIRSIISLQKKVDKLSAIVIVPQIDLQAQWQHSFEEEGVKPLLLGGYANANETKYNFGAFMINSFSDTNLNVAIATYDTFFANGGMTDVLGFSYYPFWHMRQTNREDYEHPLSWYLNAYYVKYRKPVIIAEIGEKYTEPQKTYDLLRDAVEALRNMPDGAGRGIYYWEPEAPAEVLPDRYPLGAAVMSGERTIRFTKAMRAYSAQGQITGKCRAKPRDFYV